MRKSGGNVFSLYEKVGRKRLERHWKSGGNVLECDRKSDGTVPLLNFISKNIVFEKNLRKKSKNIFFEKISESCFFVFLEKSQKKIFLFFQQKKSEKIENIFEQKYFCAGNSSLKQWIKLFMIKILEILKLHKRNLMDELLEPQQLCQRPGQTGAVR